MCPRRSGENRQGQRLRYRSRRLTLRRMSTRNKALIFGDSNCDADHFQAALCWPGADLPPEGVHCKGAELLVATRRHEGLSYTFRLAFANASCTLREDFVLAICYPVAQKQHNRKFTNE